MLTLPARLTHDLAVPALQDLRQQVLAHPGVRVVADAGALVSFDSSALAVLLACRREALAAGKGFSVQSLPARLRQLAGLYGVEELLPAAA